MHASGIAHARFNGDFHRDLKDNSKDGEYIRLNPEMRESLLRYCLLASPEVRKAERIKLDNQREAKRMKQKLIFEKKTLAIHEKYAKALTYIDMYHSPACWRNKREAKTMYNQLTSYGMQN